MTYRQMVNYGTTILEQVLIENSRADARILLMYITKMDSTSLLLNMDKEASLDVEEAYFKVIEKRESHYPLQYITKEQNFMGYDFFVDEGVLIPRQDTEILVEQSLLISLQENNQKVLDMCTGSGCIGISFDLLRKEQGFKDQVTLVDISDTAIAISKRNNTNLNAGCTIIKSDLFEEIDDKYNLIMSNPPYIRSEVIKGLMPEVKDFEPMMALDGFQDGLYFYRIISKEARKHLYEDGKLLYEIGHDQFEDVREILVSEGYSNIELVKDYAGLDRVIQADY